MNQVEYAAHRGCTKQHIGKLIKQGKIPRTSEGKIDRDVADAALAAIADPSKGAVVASNAQRYNKPLINPAVQRSLEIDAGERDVLAGLPPVAPSQTKQPDEQKIQPGTFAEAKRDRERALADQALHDLHVAQGKFVKRDTAARMAFEAGRSWRNQLVEVQDTLPTGIVSIVKQNLPNADADAVLAIGHAVTQAVIAAHRSALSNIADQLKSLAQSLDTEPN